MQNKVFLIFYSMLLFLLATSCGQQTTKEVLQLGAPEAIPSLQNNFHKAEYSPDGKYVLVTGEADNGLSVYNTGDHKVTALTQAIAAGLEMNFSTSSEKVYYVTHDYSGKKRKSSLILQDIQTGETETIVTGIRNLRLLKTMSNTILFFQDGAVKQYDLVQNKILIDTEGIIGVCADTDLNISIYKNGKISILQPFSEKDYLWVSLSPDQKRILFSIVGKATYSCDLNGDQLIKYGRLHAPKWSWDGNWVVGMDDYDDVGKYTKSDVIMIPANGGKRQNLTEDSDIIALYPTFSPNDENIVFNDENGKIYSINL